MLATLENLGVVASFSRPRVSNDNPYAESLFRTRKYRPDYPHQAFDSVDEARAWTQRFVRWYMYGRPRFAKRYARSMAKR